MKVKRGRATTTSRAEDRGEFFFSRHDRNEVFDPMPAEFIHRTKEEMAQLRKRLRAFVSSDNPVQQLLRA
jgi:hypothetical protein